MLIFPKIQTVRPLSGYRLLVTFQNNSKKVYDCTPLLTEPPFTRLQNPAYFNLVTVDAGGYGVSWDDTVDLSEAELWQNGAVAEEAGKLEFA
jgi:hypothetical protein